MATHIAIEGQVPRPVNDIKVILPAVSFPYDEITTTTGLESIIALANYEPCTVGSVPELAWNQTAVLGVATRVNGALTASYTATNLNSGDADTVLTSYKQTAIAAVNAIDDVTYNTPITFANIDNTKTVDLRPDQETLNNLVRLLVIAQNANTGISIVDAYGNLVTLTLAQAKEIGAALFENAAARVEARAVTLAAIDAAATVSAVTAAVTNHEEAYGV